MACYRTQDALGKFGSLEAWRLGLLGVSPVAPQGRSVFRFPFSVLRGGISRPLSYMSYREA